MVEDNGGALGMFQSAITALILVALVIAALALALDSFQEEMDSDTACDNAADPDVWFNATSRQCCDNSSGCSTLRGTSYAFNASEEGLTGTGNASSYLSTIGTLIGVAALIAVVMAAFYIIRR